MRKSQGNTPQEKGYDFERVFGAALGIKPTKGSGSQWHAKMDLAEANVLISCKYTQHQSFRVEKGHLKEILRACVGDQEAVMAIDIDGEIFIVQRAGDWVANMTKGGGAAFIDPSKSESRRRASKIPALFRNVEDE